MEERQFYRESETTKPITLNCPFCRTSIDQAATRCPHCTSQLTTAGA